MRGHGRSWTAYTLALLIGPVGMSAAQAQGPAQRPAQRSGRPSPAAQAAGVIADQPNSPMAPAAAVSGPTLSIDQAVTLALLRNHDAIAARLNIEGALLDRVQAAVYPNPLLSVTVGNVILGQYNPQCQATGCIQPPGAFDQVQSSVALSEVIDIWAKRSARLSTTERSIELARLRVEDALREITYAVRSSFIEVVREQEELKLSRETHARYDETVRLSRARYRSGDISEAELRKVELEGMRYKNSEIDAEMEMDLALHKLAALLGYPAPEALPGTPVMEEQRRTFQLKPLLDQAFAERPDVRAARQAKLVSEAQLSQARREALPDISLTVGYTHSNFEVSGDNPNTLSVGLSLPVPLFDRNQANIGRARLEGRRADNEAQRLAVLVQHEVGDALRRLHRGEQVLAVFEGGMLDRADTALRVAERSYHAGAISLLELLEAQRTYLETRAQFLRALYEYRQAGLDVVHAIGGKGR